MRRPGNKRRPGLTVDRHLAVAFVDVKQFAAVARPDWFEPALVRDLNLATRAGKRFYIDFSTARLGGLVGYPFSIGRELRIVPRLLEQLRFVVSLRRQYPDGTAGCHIDRLKSDPFSVPRNRTGCVDVFAGRQALFVSGSIHGFPEQVSKTISGSSEHNALAVGRPRRCLTAAL